MTSPLPQFDWDIFCCVVDNFGDIGVTWRLARQLKQEGVLPTHGDEVQVRLWVDDLASFARICPGLDPAQDSQWVDGIHIQHWHDTLPADTLPARVVIEAFACQLPASFIERMAEQMASQPRPPCWINLEYLSAESWVEDCHALASPQRVGNQSLNKYFFFPGFTARTGGLLCERGLIVERERWQQDEAGLAAYWASLGLPPKQQHELRVSLFTYESPALTSLVESWCQGATPVTLLLPLGRSLQDVLRGAGLESAITTAKAGDLLHSGNLTIKLLPMTDQAGYDRLLWSCDLNLVRGEDSFVRAQWAARPFLWHIYPQEEQAHMVKLDGFLDYYLAKLPTATGQWLRGFSHALNQRENCRDWWAQWPEHAAIWLQHGRPWSQKQLRDGDLVTRLVKFLESRI
ncbi:TPA: elongation factor P maturation arginine rhamnosyltransferase EarP [Aeromonas hydrophila]|uniref:elongation factor P maturation arginine rhamnosyltransferase EarP n=1 Tax=Aeromonas hydrophila TaxID=644 RepID=UPI001CCEBE58|nr:elongation factor P maturation arginine rhamnosyltransferase EarP [Aeromonas hydrophila]MCR3952131.1 elongation factor P maturation arginine rhamnosyltransferase EarP [Aeromonas hydrophila]MCW4614479.1 elongation factor P maturation arginine rhamnosyltransferase EarP [Aeromonas hydrophila]UBQ51675.1 elongation factor P maturation arginine rhamnosyltransferase EarP [Aeromonas hydrophila]HDI1212748.1 elongation factor P maturation arginine rhamnosyltransferase EarP [Aeromonas hydrophila]